MGEADIQLVKIYIIKTYNISPFGYLFYFRVLLVITSTLFCLDGNVNNIL